jgi:hypothetical protein
MLCANCGCEMVKKRCPSCDLYGAACVAAGAAAQHIADARHKKATRAGMNQYGIYRLHWRRMQGGGDR